MIHFFGNVRKKFEIQGYLNIFRRVPKKIEGPVLLTNVRPKIVMDVKNNELFLGFQSLRAYLAPL